jgi:DNA-binding CsgD family transcriptional regulator
VTKRRSLTPRESEIAELVSDDLTDKEIASILRVSIRTVQEHLDRIADKVGARRSPKSRRRAIRAWYSVHVRSLKRVRRITDAREVPNSSIVKA